MTIQEQLAEMGFRNRYPLGDGNLQNSVWDKGNVTFFVHNPRISVWVGGINKRFELLDEALAWVAVQKLTTR